MINENADPFELDVVDAVAGPEPEGSKLTREERIHLIVMVGNLTSAITREDVNEKDRAKIVLSDALTARGLRSHHIADVFSDHIVGGSPVTVANAFAVHPRMRAAA
jgi:hypothetical protein